MDENKQKLIGDKKIPFKELIKRCWVYFKPVRFRVIIAFIFILFNTAFDVVLPLIIRDVVDNLKDPTNIALRVIITFAISYFVISLLNQLFRFFETFLLQKAGQSIVYELRVETFKHIEKMSLDQFEVMPVGSLVTRVCNYTSQLSDLFTNQITQLLRNFFTIIGVFGVMLSISPMLSLIILGFAVVVLIISFVMRKVISKLSRLEKGYLSDLNTALSENLSGMKVIQIFNQEKRIRDEFFIKNKKYRDIRYKIMLCFIMYWPFVNFLLYVSTSVVFLAGAGFELSAGSIVAFYLFISKFFDPIQRISDQFLHIERALSSTERLFNLLDVEPKVVDKKDALKVDTFKGKIEFRHVWFSYDDKNWVLKDVNFVIEAGKTCAFVGATGAGKTTIFSLLNKSYVPQKGQILIDDIDINDIEISSIRNAIGQMLQDVFLFSGDIKSNLTLFDENVADEEVYKTISYVNADKFIETFDKGIYEEIVEKGDNLSQGQKQLLSFARTILHKPQILLLDEATANIDTETEVLIQDSLNKMKSLGTMLVVAHRLSTIQKADEIICLQNGEVVEIGDHKSLLAKKGYYYKLYELQFK